MLNKTSGIILYTTKYADTSLIAKIYTSDFGLQSYIINGVRSKKSKSKATLFQPLSLVEMVVSNSNKGNLQRISEINNQHPYVDIPYNIVKSSIAIFLNEVLYKTLKEEHADEEIFEFIKNSLLILDLKTDNCSCFHIYFLVQLSRFLGFYPQGNYSEETKYFDLKEGRFVLNIPSHSNYLVPEIAQLFDNLSNVNYETLAQLQINKAQRKILLQQIVLYYQLHMPSIGVIKSIDVLEEVIS
jgi:DNA repair protein RecO (recombination protein O)